MRRFLRLARPALAAAVALGLGAVASRPASAAFVFTMLEVGTDVQITGTGTIDTAALTYNRHGSSGQGLIASIGVIGFGTFVGGLAGPDVYLWTLSGPASFGTGGVVNFTGTGDYLNFDAGHHLIVPHNYVSGSPLSDFATIANTDFATLGVTPGSYVWSWGSGATYDTFTLNIGPIPEPATALLLGLPMAAAALARRRRAGG